MKPWTFFVALLSGLLHCAQASLDAIQVPLMGDQALLSSSRAVKNVAIIGAGAAGSSAAYFLSQFSREQSLDLNLTIFERNSYIGGRSTTVYAYDEPSEPVELGASVYVQVNKILVKAAQDLNLTVSSNDASTQRETLGIWNGQGFVWTQATSGQAWFEDYWNLVRLFWRYGSAPRKAMDLMLTVVNRFLEIYEAPHFPFASLSDAALALNLTGVTALTSLQHCLQHGIGERFVTEIIQAATRVNYAQNVASIHGLEGMVSLAANGAMSIEAGNWQIFARMLEQSRAHLLLDTAARSISWDESSHKFTISYTSAKMSPSALANEQFDQVIIAAPFHQTGIDVHPALGKIPDNVPYVKLHVTLICSSMPISGRIFGVETVPNVILTTLPPGGNASDTLPFKSISLLRRPTNPLTGERDYLYKIFSTQDRYPANSDLEDLFQADPKTVVTWVHRKTWLSYPVEYPRVTFEESKLRNGLWYTSGMDSFISTMETNSLMGKNVAQLIADEWIIS